MPPIGGARCLAEPRSRVILPDLAAARPNTWVALHRAYTGPTEEGYAQQVIEFARRRPQGCASGHWLRDNALRRPSDVLVLTAWE